MRRFLLKTGIYLGSFFVILFLFEFFSNVYFSNKSFYKLDEPVHTLILGNSHPECALNDSILPNCLNMAQSAEPYFYSYIKLKSLVEANANIRFVVLEYTNVAFSMSMNDWMFGQRYMPHKYPLYSHLISTSDKFLLLKENPLVYFDAFGVGLSKKWALSVGLVKKWALNYRYPSRLHHELGWGGYLYLDKFTVPEIKAELCKDSSIIEKVDNRQVADMNISYLSDIIRFCQQRNVKVILFRSPLHPLYERVYEQQLLDLYRNEFNNIEFWDYADFPLSDDEFGDLEHLNYKGARIFSDSIAHRLKRLDAARKP